MAPLSSINAQYGGFNDSPFKEGALVTAVKTGRLQDLVSALNSGASINEKDFDEVPALLLAIERSRMDMVLFLALDWAKAKRFKRIEDLLIENGAYN